MSDKNKIKDLLKEAEIYRAQGLPEQARDRYFEIIDFIKESKELREKESFFDYINKKIQNVDKAIKDIESADENPQLSEDIQNLICSLFSFSKNKEIAAIEGAVALEKFGQHEKALAKFRMLTKNSPLPMITAKNLLKYQFSFSSPEKAVQQFKKWASSNIFNETDLKKLKEFLKDMLIKECVSSKISQADDEIYENKNNEVCDENVFEISSIRANLEDNARASQNTDFEITFQLGKTVRFIVAAENEKLVNALKPGQRLSEVKCFSPLSVFNAQAVVAEKKKITSGLKQGNYSFELIVEGP